ncbi:hypothetical protein [Cecembia sp.]|uniref:hypothetical protein n=1 Tax=Cecembia sp. TaxID=1898110 RepID=UPI0025B82ECB|nr:hypothetical protein [Cecembia sp.]
MVTGQELDPDFWKKSKEFFLHFQDQVDLIQALFTTVANAFPQDRLSLHFNSPKGCRISKGSQLARLPYQVLDIVRDFDQEKGFNIRFLNWWGYGFFIFITYGVQTKNSFPVNRISYFQNFKLYSRESAFDYMDIMQSQMAVSAENLVAAINTSSQLILWKEIALPKDPKKASELIMRLTEDILSYHNR